VENLQNLTSSEVSQDEKPLFFRLDVHVVGGPALSRQGLPEEVSVNKMTHEFMVLTATTMKMAVGMTTQKRDVLK
jgi:hypothetical protein